MCCQLCADYADLTARDDEAAAAHEETNLFENLVFVVRNYQGDDQEPGERPHLFQEVSIKIISQLQFFSQIQQLF